MPPDELLEPTYAVRVRYQSGKTEVRWVTPMASSAHMLCSMLQADADRAHPDDGVLSAEVVELTAATWTAIPVPDTWPS